MNIVFENLLVYSEENKKYFFTTFGDKINIVKGKNTSGKSSLIQSIIYSFGINDNSVKLAEILNYNVFFRLDLIITNDSKKRKLSFIRDSGVFFIVENGKVSNRFDGINGDKSAEHIKLKKTLSSLFNFSMVLESKEQLKDAPIEAMLLPYYVSQSVGCIWTPQGLQ